MKILEIDDGGLDISVEEPIQHVIIHTFSVNLKNVNTLDVICLCLRTLRSAQLDQPMVRRPKKRTLEVRGFRGPRASGVRALVHSHTFETSVRVGTGG